MMSTKDWMRKGMGRRCFFIGLLLSCAALLGGCKVWSQNSGNTLDNGYTIVSTGVRADDTLSYSWCDEHHLLVDENDYDKGVSRLRYVDVRDPAKALIIDPVDDQGKLLYAGGYECPQNQFVASRPAFENWADHPNVTPFGHMYVMRPGQKPEWLADAKGRTVVNFDAKYILSGKVKIVTDNGYRLDEECVLNHRPDYTVYCWDNLDSGDEVWPLNNFVLATYNWQEDLRLRKNDGDVVDRKNQDPPKYFDPSGRPDLFALVLYTLDGKPLARLDRDPVYGINHYSLVTSGDEQYAYSPCGHRDRADDNRVCRFRLDGKQNQWEEVFNIEEMGIPEAARRKASFGAVAISPDGSIDFEIESYPLSKIDGIWKFHASTRTFTQVTRDERGFRNTDPKISPDGKVLAFIRPVIKIGPQVFIAQQK